MSAFGAGYADELADALCDDLVRSLSDYSPVEVRVAALAGSDAVEVRVRRVEDGATAVERYRVDEVVYHYRPDGTDVARHAAWLSELFQEDHTGVVHRGYHGPPLPAIVQYPDGRREVLSADEAARRFGTNGSSP